MSIEDAIADLTARIKDVSQQAVIRVKRRSDEEASIRVYAPVDQETAIKAATPQDDIPSVRRCAPAPRPEKRLPMIELMPPTVFCIRLFLPA